MKVERNLLTKKIEKSVRDAAKIAIPYYGKGGMIQNDGTWLTEADGKVSSFLREEINQAVAPIGSTVRFFAEGLSGFLGPDHAEYTVIADPIEGTALFAHGIPLWGISVSVFKGTKVIWAGFMMPKISQFFIATEDVATLNGRPLVIAPEPEPISIASYLAVSSNAHKWNLTAYPGKIRAYGSTSFHILSVTTGQIQGAFVSRARGWDLVCAGSIHKAAGGSLVYYPSGKPVDLSDALKDPKSFNLPILASHPQQVDELLKMKFSRK